MRLIVVPTLFSLSIPAKGVPLSNITNSGANCSLPPLVTLEEHFASQAFINSSFNSELGLEYYLPQQVTQLEDLDNGRINDLNAGGISTQVISQTPTMHVPPANMCIAANNELAAAIDRHPGRYAGFAVLPMLDPTAAAAELERTVKDLGFVGTLIPDHANGRYYDDAFFWPIFQKAEDLNVPVYLHPTWTADDQKSHFIGNYSSVMELALSTYGYGWHADTGLSFLRAWAGGLFDAFPNLKMVLGHDGEAIPFWIGKIEPYLDTVKLPSQRSFNETFAENLWFTTSGQFTLQPLETLLGRVDPSRIMYSVDYPLGTNVEGKAFMETLRGSGLVDEEEFEMIAYKNARELLGL